MFVEFNLVKKVPVYDQHVVKQRMILNQSESMRISCLCITFYLLLMSYLIYSIKKKIEIQNLVAQVNYYLSIFSKFSGNPLFLTGGVRTICLVIYIAENLNVFYSVSAE
jgi:hypothetical protein